MKLCAKNVRILILNYFKFTDARFSYRSEEHTSELQSPAMISYAVFCLKKKPLLGICYGAEILALTLGGTLKKMDKVHKGIEEIKIVKTNPLCSDRMKVFESHSYMISRIDKLFDKIAESNVCKFEIIQHRDSYIFGTQFHPEMSGDGKILLEKFVLI